MRSSRVLVVAFLALLTTVVPAAISGAKGGHGHPHAARPHKAPKAAKAHKGAKAHKAPKAHGRSGAAAQSTAGIRALAARLTARSRVLAAQGQQHAAKKLAHRARKLAKKARMAKRKHSARRKRAHRPKHHGSGPRARAARAAPAPAPAASVVAPAAAPAPAAASKPRPASKRHQPRRSTSSPNRVLAPAAFVLQPLGRAVAEIPDAVWFALVALALLAVALALVSLLQSRRAVALAAARRDLQADLDTLSGAVMPAVPGVLEGLALSAATRPVRGPASGADFYDAFELDDGRAAVVVGDVAGKGREAVAATVLVRHTLRAYLEAGLEPRAALATAGTVLAERHEGLLAAAVVAVHDRARSTLTLASAGHEPPIVLGGGGHRPVEVAWPPPLGAPVPTGRRQTTMPLAPGATVCLFTDGASEARVGGERLGSAGLAAWIEELGPEASAEDVIASLRRRADEIDDDVTVCVLRSRDQRTAARADLVEELAVSPGEGPTLIRFLIACGVTPSRAAELAVTLEQAPERATMLAQVRIDERGARAQLRPARPSAFAAA